MASLRQSPNSSIWIACFTLPNGTRTQRSTGIPIGGVAQADLEPIRKALAKTLGVEITFGKSGEAAGGLNPREAKRLAQKIADHYEDASREARSQRFSQTRARSVIADIYSMANRDKLANSCIEDYFQAWLDRKKLEAGEKTHVRYAAVVEDLMEHLGARRKMDILQLSTQDISSFREKLVKKLSGSSTNVSLKVVRSALAQARREGLVDTNVAENVSLLKNLDVSERRPFTLEELKRILAVANDEWRGMILTGLYTGLRLSDVATLTWSNINLQHGELAVVTAKTGRRQILPLAKPLLAHLENLPAGDDPDAPLFPEAYAARQRSQYGGTLSNQFYGILVAAGLAKPRPHLSTGKGRDAKRNVGGPSFHALRHTATSLLKNAGVSDAVAMDIIGHESAAVSRNYTHIDRETKRAALDKMPDICAP
ncbi:MAG: tyrosine-type recombinase/integrase [Candidatus Omnitrophica bacterium]|nr:tyrosine-type recombinase/integrase [Candidatus Omnitrophota bacterium]